MSSTSQRFLAEAAAETLQRIREDRERVEEDRVRSMLAYLEKHLFDYGLNVKSLMHHCGLRDNSIPVRFTSALGIPPGGYIEDRRMETAGRLLVDTNLGVGLIGELVGYSRIQVFSRAFLRWFRVRPGVYRREQRKRLPAPPPDPAAPKPGAPLPEPMLREIPITGMWHELSLLPDQLAAQPGAVAVTREGEPVLAVMSWELFESLLEIIADWARLSLQACADGQHAVGEAMRSRKTRMSGEPQQLLAAAAAGALQCIREDRELVEEDRVRLMLAQIEEHLFDRDLNVTTLRRHCGFRDRSVVMRFPTALGVTPGGYIEDRRMETAGRLLVDTNLGVGRIGKLVGYSGVQVFSRAFLRWFGVRPSAYRQQQRKRLAALAPDPAARKPGALLTEPVLREIPITRMWGELPSLVEQLAAQLGTVAVTRRGESVLAVMSWELFEWFLEIIED